MQLANKKIEAAKKEGKTIVFPTLDPENYIEKLLNFEAREEVEQKLMEPLGIDHLFITKKLAAIESENILNRKLLIANSCIVRAYIINGRNFASRDIGSPSDPYLIVSCGD